MIVRHFLAAIFLLFANFSVLAQNNERVFWNYDISDGLPTNSLYHVLIDHSDRIWFGSDYGVTCFDGKTFKTFTVEDGLLDNTVIRCYEDSLNRIWFQHVSSLPTYYFNGEIHQLENVDQSIRLSVLSQIIEPKKGELIIGAFKDRNGGLLKVDQKLKCEFSPSIGTGITTLGMRNETIFFATDPKGAEVMSKYFPKIRKKNFDSYRQSAQVNFDLDLGAFSRSAMYYEAKDNDLAAEFKFKKVYHIIKNDKTKIFATSDGIFEFRIKKGQWVFKAHYLPNEIFVSAMQDSEGNIWATSLNHGLFKISQTNYSQIQLERNQRCVYSIEHNGEVYIEGENLDLSKIKGQILQKSPEKPKKSITTEIGYGFLFYKNFSIYNYDSNWYLYEIKSGKSEKIELADDHISFGQLFVSNRYKDRIYTYGLFGIAMIDLSQRPYSERILNTSLGRTKCITETQKALYVGTQKGLFVQDGKNEMDFHAFFPDVFGNSRISGFYLNQDQILIATGDKGIWIYDQKTSILKPWSQNILSNGVKGIYKGKKESFWVHTDVGVQQFSFRNNQWNETQRMDLKTTLKVNDVVNIHEIEDTLIVVTNTTIFYLPLEKNKLLKKINFALEGLKVNGTFRELTKTLSFKHDENNLNFLFSCVNHSAHPTMLYYRINGGEWVKNDNDNFNFSSLSAGEYTFDFKAESSFYKPSFLFGYKIKINPTWWQSTWVLLISFTLILILVVLLVRWRIIKTQERKRRSLSIELFSLQSQMNPHFTFNSLNSVQSYLSNNDKRSAQIYLADFAVLMRNIMDQAKLNLITLEEEVQFLTQYLNLEKRRLDNKFNYTFHIDEELIIDQTYIPTLMLQPFVENAIWHGVAALDYAGQISVSFKMKGDKLICEVKDNGLGLNQEKKSKPYHKSTGINNIRERIRLFEELFNKKMEIDIIDNSQNNLTGVCVQLVIPKLTLQNKLT